MVLLFSAPTQQAYIELPRDCAAPFQVMRLDYSTISHPGFAFDAADVTATPIFSDN